MFSPISIVVRLRIVLLCVDTDIWCVFCGALCATTITYLIEDPDRVLPGLHWLICCDACEKRDVP